MTDGHQPQQRPLQAAAGSQERPVLPTGALGRTGRLAMLPLRHAARTAAAASRLSRATIRLARQSGALAPGAEVDPRLIIELLHPLAATGADTSFTYSRAWLRGLRHTGHVRSR